MTLLRILVALPLVLTPLAEAAAPRMRMARRFVPLLPPPRYTSSTVLPAPPAAAATDRLAPQPDTDELEAEISSTDSEQKIGLGVDLGLLARRQGTNGGALGFEWFPGLRATARIPIRDRWYGKASFGYFRHADGTNAFTFSQNVIELGAALQYSVWRSNRFRFLVGGVLRGDARFTQTSYMGKSTTSPMELSIRPGPQVGLLYGLNSRWSLTTDLDTTIDLREGRLFLSVAAGVIWYWK